MDGPAPPGSLQSRLTEAAALLSRRQAAAALDLLEPLVVAGNAPAAVWLLLARARQAMGRIGPMLDAARHAARLSPQDREAALLLVEALVQNGQRREAGDILARLEQDAGNDAALLDRIGTIHSHGSRHLDAERCYGRAVQLQPGHQPYRYNHATALMALGRMAAAEQALDRLIQADPADADAWYNRSTLRRQTAEQNHVAGLLRRLQALRATARGPGPARGEVELCYALAKELEDLGDHAAAFQALRRGATARRAMMSYRVEQDLETMAALRETFTPDAIAGARTGDGGDGVLFVLGLPRSGTTLVDRILSSHPQVESLGEITDLTMSLLDVLGRAPPRLELVQASLKVDFAAVGRRYMDRIRQYGAARPVLIDKNPVNFLSVAIIRLALPRARIVHLTRDPMDSCFAMYKTLFRMGYPFSYDLNDLGRYYLGQAALMDHWRRLFPGTLLDLPYERLVAAQEEETRRLLDHCGLDFHPDCLEFHRNTAPTATASAAQVRQPLHARSVGAWRRHAADLEPLARILRAGGIPVPPLPGGA